MEQETKIHPNWLIRMTLLGATGAVIGSFIDPGIGTLIGAGAGILLGSPLPKLILEAGLGNAASDVAESVITDDK